MVLTNFPNGVSSFGMPVIGSGDVPSTSGTYFFVNSVTGSDSYDGSFETPFGTIDYAIGKCTADKGDTIVVLPNHAESLVAAGTITADVAGVTIVGLGFGDERPTLTFSTLTSASFLISAANVTVKNILGVAGIDAIANPFDVTGDNCTLDIEWQDVQASYGAIRAVRNVAGDNFKLNLRFRGDTSMGSGINAVRLTNVAGARINIDYYGVVTTAVVQMVTTACTDVRITGSAYVVGTTTGALNVVDTTAASTWSADLWDGSAGAWYSASHNAAGAVNSAPETSVKTGTAVIANGTATIFTVAGGPIEIENIVAVCVTTNDATATTLKFTADPTDGAATDLCAASASLANAAAGTIVNITGTLANAGVVTTNGTAISQAGKVVVPAGVLQTITAVGATTGTWYVAMRYKPLAPGVTVTPAY